MKSSNAVGRAIVVLRSEGLKSFWFKLLGEVGYRRLVLLERPLAQPITEFTPGLPVRIDPLKDSEVGDYLAFRPEAGRVRVIDALQSGQTCFVARHQGRIVSAGWVAGRRARSDYLGCELELAAGDAYLSDAFTLPAYRGQGIAPALCLQQLRHLRQAGYARAIRGTVPEKQERLAGSRQERFPPGRCDRHAPHRAVAENLQATVGPPNMSKFYPAGNVLQRAFAVLRDEGLRSFWFKLIGEFGYRRMLVVEYRLDDPIPEFTATLPVRNDLLKAGEVDDYLAFRPEIGRPEVIGRLDAGQLCFVAWHEGRIVSACWSSTRPVRIEYLGCQSPLADGDVYLYDKFTLPAYRGHRIANAVRMNQLRHLRQAGCRRAIGALVQENTTSVRENTRGGFRPVAVIGRIKVGPWQRIFRRRWEV